MKINQPTAIGLAAGSVVLAVGMIWWTVKSNTVGPPPPISAGVAAPDPAAKPVVTPMSTTPGMSLGAPGSSMPAPGTSMPTPGTSMPAPGGMHP